MVEHMEDPMKEEKLKSLPFKAAVFDMDGVITSTVNSHFEGWKKMFTKDAGLADFTWEDYLKHVDGVPRKNGIENLLNAKGIKSSEEEMDRLAEIKQGYFMDFAKELGIEKFPSTIEMIKELRKRGVKIAVATSSKNADFVFEQAGIPLKTFDVIVANNKIIVDHGEVIKAGEQKTVEITGKPDIFKAAIEALGVPADQTIGFEDAELGVKALRSHGIWTVAINRKNSEKEKEALLASGPDIMVNDLKETTVDSLASLFSKK